MIKVSAYLIHGSLPIYGVPKAMQTIGQGYVGAIPIPVMIFVIIAMIGAFDLKRAS